MVHIARHDSQTNTLKAGIAAAIATSLHHQFMGYIELPAPTGAAARGGANQGRLGECNARRALFELADHCRLIEACIPQQG